jgi:uroporphyrinogen decarboxylase
MDAMTSRERVLLALNHQEPDRVPLDIGGGTSTSISIAAYDKLKAYLGITAPTKTLSNLYQTAQVDGDVMALLGGDCWPLRNKSPHNWTPPPSEPGTMIDLWGVKWKRVPQSSGGFYWETICSPLAEATLDDPDKYLWPDPADPGFTAGLSEEAKSLHENTHYAIEASCGYYSFWEVGFALRGFERLLTDLVSDPDFVTGLMTKLLRINLAITERFLDAAGPYFDVFRAGDDLATQTGLLMSPRTFRTLLKPFYEQYFDLVKSKTKAKIIFHSCGNIVGLLDDLIEVGIDGINPVQVSAIGDTAELKKRYGQELTLWGSIDTQKVLPYGSPAEVEAEVRRRIHDLAPGGGYVLAGVHALQPDVPPENILSMSKAARTFGTYPIRV